MGFKRYTRREFLRIACAGLSPLLLGTGAHLRAADSHPPNVILIMTDDQGYGDLGCYGNPVLETPNLDNLYRQSVRLEDFHVSPTCSPTRSALMTGHYTNRAGAWHTIMGRSLLFEDEVTMADVFARNGYRTGIFGKWHLGDNFPFRPQDRGFQEVLANGGGGVGQTPDYWGNDYSDDTYFHNGNPRSFRGYCTDVWFDGALQFIETNRNRPFFCYLPTNAAHEPYNVPVKYVDHYRKKGVEDESLARFYGMIHNIDENVARLEARLDEWNLKENTILIFLTDNGTSGHGYNAGMRGRKGSEYDGGHRVPCFIRWPGGGIQGGRSVTHLTAHIDLLPTLIELCKMEPPKDVEFDGASLVPLLTRENPSWKERILIADSQRVEDPIKWRRSAVMTDRWRLVNGEELYDMNQDPGQQEDVAGNHPQVVQRLRKAYENWWEDISPRFEKYARIMVGAEQENPVHLTCHDWHTEDRVPWNQNYIRQGLESNGSWMLQVSRPGTYEIGLRRWPVEVNRPITSPVPGGTDLYMSQPMVTDPVPAGKAIRATAARIRIADHDLTQEVPVDASVVRFRLTLEPGPVRLHTWFTAEDESRGAYYVSVKRLEG